METEINNKKAVYHAWMSLAEAIQFAERGNRSLEEEIKLLNDMGFAVIDWNKNEICEINNSKQ